MIKKLRTLALAFAFALAPLAAHASGWVGAYIWSGTLGTTYGSNAATPQKIYNTANYAMAHGFNTLRFNVNPENFKGDYNLAVDPCAGNQNDACYAQVLFASSVYDNPNLQRIILNVYDFTTWNSGSTTHPFDTTWLTANAIAIKAEYTALFTYLNTRFAGRNIQFILDNWEGDNAIFCGSANLFALGSTFTTSCIASYVNGQSNAGRIDAYLQWQGLRDTAITNFMASNPEFSIINAIQFSNHTLFVTSPGGNCNTYCNAATDTLLAQFLVVNSGGKQAHCDYSSYNSQGPPGNGYITDIVNILATYCGDLIIGEFGWDADVTPVATIAATFRGVIQLLGQVPGVIGTTPWIFMQDLSAPTSTSLFNGDGTPNQYVYMGSLAPPLPSIPQHR